MKLTKPVIIKLTNPVIITSRLLPGLRIDGAELSIEFGGHTEEGRVKYHYFIDIPGIKTYENDDIKSGRGGGTLQEGLASLVAFLSAAGESFRYSGKDGENADLFPTKVVQWAAEHGDELSMLSSELDENKCIE